MDKKLESRFWSKLKKTDSCWIWTASKDLDGYGRFFLEGRSISSHRFSYEHWNGKIPDELQIDHICRNRACVNPEHMEIVTSKENTLKGSGPTAVNSRKTHCPQGHEYSEENTYNSNGARTCKICKKLRVSLSRQRKKLEINN